MTTWQPRLRVKHSITSLFFRGSTGLQPSAVQSLSWRRTATWTEPQGLKRPVLVVTHGFVKFWLYIGNVQLEPLCFRVFWNVNLNINMFCLYHRQFILVLLVHIKKKCGIDYSFKTRVPQNHDVMFDSVGNFLHQNQKCQPFNFKPDTLEWQIINSQEYAMSRCLYCGSLWVCVCACACVESWRWTMMHRYCNLQMSANLHQ